MEDEIFFVGQKAFIEKDGQVLTLVDETLGIDFPGGKIQLGEEDIQESLKREIREETGLVVEIFEPFITWVHVARKGEIRGKKIFIVGYKCKYMSGEVKLSDEHTGFKWVDKNNYLQIDDGKEYFKYLTSYFQGA